MFSQDNEEEEESKAKAHDFICLSRSSCQIGGSEGFKSTREVVMDGQNSSLVRQA